jgi:hypothetical protein
MIYQKFQKSSKDLNHGNDEMTIGSRTIEIDPYVSGIANAVFLLQSGLPMDEVLETFREPHAP